MEWILTAKISLVEYPSAQFWGQYYFYFISMISQIFLPKRNNFSSAEDTNIDIESKNLKNLEKTMNFELKNNTNGSYAATAYHLLK